MDTFTVYCFGCGFRSVAMVDGQIVQAEVVPGPNDNVAALSIRALSMAPDFLAAVANGRVLVMPGAQWSEIPTDTLVEHVRDLRYDRAILCWIRDAENRGPKRPAVLAAVYGALADSYERTDSYPTRRRKARAKANRYRAIVDAQPKPDAVEIKPDPRGLGEAVCGAGYEGMCGGHGGPENTASYWRWRGNGCPRP